jgi:hypothetical protein
MAMFALHPKENNAMLAGINSQLTEYGFGKEVNKWVM